MNFLNLTLKKPWYDSVASGDRKEEYREITPYWKSRLLNKKYDIAVFRNGYAIRSEKVFVEVLGIKEGYGKKEWGAEEGKEVYVIQLGRRFRKDGDKFFVIED